MKNQLLKYAVVGLMAAGAFTFSQVPVKAENTPDQKKQIEELKKSYPLDTCVVSGEKLEPGEMGAPVDYLYKQKGADGKETTRLVRFCCPGCIKKFNSDPAKYLKLIDAAGQTKKTAATTPPAGCPACQ
ncbi:MAG: hypothetical protein PHD76_03600 [Methylacidiphilales bacterium]|nr:hypothetical protein [Candidatus Methylacidiphilales bacterium]